MRDEEEMLGVGEDAVKLALSRGAEAAEAYVADSRTTTVSAAGRYVEPTESATFAIGVRVIVGGRIGVSGATSLASIPRAIDEALESVRAGGTTGRVSTFPAPRADPRPRVSLDARLREDRSEPIGALAETAMAAALARGGVSYAYLSLVSFVRRVAIVNSSGVRVADESGFERMEMEMRVTRGTTHRSGTDAHYARGPIDERYDGAALSRDLIDRISSGMDGQQMSSSVDEAIFYPGPANQLLKMAQGSFNAKSGTRVGEQRYASCITLHDAPRGPEGTRWRNVDDEGVPTRDAVLVREGRVETLLHDARSAADAGVEPTGTGFRGSAAQNAAPRAANLLLDAGDMSLDELIGSAGRAVLVTEALLGGFTHNQSTGDFSVVVPYAFLVENGRIRHALPPTTIGGNAHKVLREAKAVGRERRTYSAATLPAIRAGGVSCAT